MLSLRLSERRVVLIEEISTHEILTIQFNRLQGITLLCSEHFEIWYGAKMISIFTAASEMGFRIQNKITAWLICSFTNSS